MIDGNKLGRAGYKYLGTKYSKMDCQAFVEQCLRDCGTNKNLAGSNAWYREVMSHGWVGTPEECVKTFGSVPAGAFLFILSQDGNEPAKYRGDGIGNASHIGIVTNESAQEMMAEILAGIELALDQKAFILNVSHGDGAIHSSSSRGCVCTSKFVGKTIPNGGWNRIGLWNQIAFDYGGGIEPDAPIPDQEPQTATVWAKSGSTVNLRIKPSKSASKIEAVKIGEEVDILEYGGTWCRIRWKDKVGYMMTEFLKISEKEQLYCVTVHDLPKLLAEEIANTYGGSITKEKPKT